MRREEPIQRALVQYLRAVLPGALVHHARNEINKRGSGISRELAQAAQLGAVKGFPDIIAILSATQGVLFFEVKAPGNSATAAQRAIHAQLEGLGHRVAVVRSIDDVRSALDAWAIWRADRNTIGGK